MNWNEHHNNWDYDISCHKVWTEQVHIFTEICARFLQRDMSAPSHDGNKVTILKVQEETRCARGHYCGCDISCSKCWTYKSFQPGYRGSLCSQQFTMLIIQHHSLAAQPSSDISMTKYSIQTSACAINTLVNTLMPRPVYTITIPLACHSQQPFLYNTIFWLDLHVAANIGLLGTWWRQYSNLKCWDLFMQW